MWKERQLWPLWSLLASSPAVLVSRITTLIVWFTVIVTKHRFQTLYPTVLDIKAPINLLYAAQYSFSPPIYKTDERNKSRRVLRGMVTRHSGKCRTHRLHSEMKSYIQISTLIHINPSTRHEIAQESWTWSYIWLVLRVMDSLPQVALGGGSCGLYGPWKFQRVNTGGYDRAATNIQREKEETGRMSVKTLRSFHI